MKKIILILTVLFIAALILPVAALAAPVGKITALEGKVDMTPSGAKDAVPVAVGVSVNAGDILRAKSKSKAEITFPDGNILRLAENTRLRVTQYQPEEGKKSYVNLFRGKTVAVVDKLRKGSNFEVHTPTAICGVRGTVFYSSYQSGQSSFVFQSGTGYGYNVNRPDQVVAIPPKVFMVIQAADKAPLLRPATDVEIDKHQKDTTLVGKPKEEVKKEEEKKPDSLTAVKDEGKPKEEKKEEQAKTDKPAGEAKTKTADKGGETTSGSAAGPAPTPAAGTGQPQSPATASAPANDAATQTINQVLYTEKQPVPQTTLLITTTPVTQPIKSETVVQKDNTPPDVSFTLTPPSLTKDTSASFSYNSNEKVDYQYRLNSGAWQIGPSSTQSGSTNITVPADGNNTFEIKATDSGGNFTTKSYSWTTDNTGPVVTIAPQAAFPAGTGTADVDVKLTSNEANTTYKYKKDDETAYQDTSDQFTITGLDGQTNKDHTIYANGTDSLGNVGTDSTKAFKISRHDSGGKSWATGDMTSTNVQVKFAGVSNESWGSWELKDNGSGTPASSWNYYAGKANDTDIAADQMYYWLQKASGTAADNNISGTSSAMRYINWNTIGQGSNGAISGSYGDGTWSATDTGKGKYKENPLKFASLIGIWDNGIQKSATLAYTRKPEMNWTLIAEQKTYQPLRIDLLWKGSWITYATTWIPSQGNGVVPYQINNEQMGSRGYNKFRYPSSYLYYYDTDGWMRDRTSISRLQQGDTYFAIEKRGSGSPTDITVKIDEVYYRYNNPTEENIVVKDTLTESNPTNTAVKWWNMYKITKADNDPEGSYSIYYSGVQGDYSPVDTQYVQDASIRGILGGPQSIVTGEAANIPLRLIGDYSLNEGADTTMNRGWSQEIVAYNADATGNSKYVTRDDAPGTYFGVLAGLFRPGREAVEGGLSAFYVDSNKNVGLLKGQFGRNDYLGKIYPGISMWEADGTANRYEMVTASSIDPADLSGAWYAVTAGSDDQRDSWGNANTDVTKIHQSSWKWISNPYLGVHDNTWGAFFASDYTSRVNMTDREDYLNIYKLNKVDTFGVWGWRALGKYSDKKDSWIISSDPRFLSDGNYAMRTNLLAYGNTGWSMDRFSGRVTGNMAYAMKNDYTSTAGTAVIAGDFGGVYNDSLSMFTAGGGGSWIETATYLSMLSTSPATLSGLGYPTEEYSPTSLSPRNLTGELASKPAEAVQLTNLRVFNIPEMSVVKLWATDDLKATTGMVKYARYPITGTSEERPVYGHMWSDYNNSANSTWLGGLRAMGVFDTAEGVKQVSFDGGAAGSYNDSGFSGTAAGYWMPAQFISQLTRDSYVDPSVADPDKDKRAYLRYYDAADGTYKTEGFLKGLSSTGDPLILGESISYPAYPQLNMTGVWVPEDGSATLGSRSHIFNTTIYPKNYETSTAGSPVYTTTAGHSFWGYLSGIHQSSSNNERQDGLEALWGTLFVDKNGYAGLMGGKIGGPGIGDSNSYGWGYDRTTQSFFIDSYSQDLPLVRIGDTKLASITASTLVTSGIATRQNPWVGGYQPPAGQEQYADQYLGEFFNGTSALGTYLKIPNGSSMLSKSAWINDASVTNSGAWGVWSTEFYGAFDAPSSTTPDHWFGEIKSPDAAKEKIMGAQILGETWQNNRTIGGINGFLADITNSALTGVSFGNILGTFDPNNYTFQAVANGAFFETARYMDMADTKAGREVLNTLNIPCVQVGSVSLGGNTSDNNIRVDMNQVKFFAYATGAVPAVWGTKDVSGSYQQQAPTQGTTVPLSDKNSQTNITANFVFQSWNNNNNGKYTATVAGSGDVGNTVNLQGLNFKGASAGNISGKTFSGTGAGIVKK